MGVDAVLLRFLFEERRQLGWGSMQFCNMLPFLFEERKRFGGQSTLIVRALASSSTGKARCASVELGVGSSGM